MTNWEYGSVLEKINFNSHAHVERDNMAYAATLTAENFNSHAHVERDIYSGFATGTNYISTHTLTWSVT